MKYIKKVKYLIFLILIASCSLNTQSNYYIDEDFRFKLAEKDILIYINQDNYTDTFDLVHENGEYIYSGEIGGVNNPVYSETESIKLIHNKNIFDTTDYELSIFKNANYKIEDKPFSASIYINEFWQVSSEVYFDFYESINVNSISYDNVFLFWDPDIAPSLNLINKIYYTHQYGIIKYEKSSGEIWELKR